MLREHELSWYALNFVSACPAIIFSLTYITVGPGWDQNPLCRVPHKTQQEEFTFHRSYIFLKACSFFRVEWHLNKECLKYCLNCYVFGWNNFFEDMDVGRMLLQSRKPGSVPWNTDTAGNKTTVKPLSLKSLYLLFLLEWFWKTACCFGANLSTCSK